MEDTDAESGRPMTSRLQASAVRASAWTAIQAVAGFPLTVVVNLAVARTLGVDGYGRVAVYIAAYAILLTVLNAGISDAAIQWGAAAYARRDTAELLGLARRCAGFHVLVEAPAAAAAVFLLLWRESLTVQLVTAASAAVTMAIGTVVVMMTAISLNTNLAKINLATTLGLQTAVVSAALESHHAGPTWAARIAFGALGPLLAIAVCPRDLRRACFRPLLPRRWPAGLVAFSFRTLLATLVATLVFSRCEVLALNAYGDVAAAGVFALAAGLAAQMTAPVDAMLGPLVPAAAGLLEIGRDRAAAAILRGTRLSAAATAPLAVIVIPAVALLVPAVYGDAFRQSGTLFLVLAVTSCLQSALHATTAFLAALRRPLLALGINAWALAVDVTLVLALIPPFGAWGAVIGNSLGQLTSLALCTVVLRRQLGLGVGATARAVAPLANVALAACAVTALAIWIGDHRLPIIVAVIAVAASSAIAMGILRLTGGLVTRSDLEVVGESFPRVISWIPSSGPRSRWVLRQP